MEIKNHPSYKYAKRVVDGKLKDIDGGTTEAPGYVVKQCREFIRIADGGDQAWEISERKVKQISAIMKLLIMPKGLKAGQTFYSCTTPYQWLFITAVLATVARDDENRRKYQRAILEIGRKNFKTYTIAIVFILLFVTEPNFSKFYSVAPDGSLSREVKEAISETLKASPLLYEYRGTKRWKILRDYIEFIPTETKYIPLNYSNSRFDGKLPNAFLADEVGALPNAYAIEAMMSGQLNIKNKLGCIISTKYPTVDNPFEDEVAYAKKVLDGIVKDETLFALLYEPNETKDWMTDDEILRQANPVSLDSREIWDDLVSKRQRAIEIESARENFVTKHCNIIYQGAATESYIDVGAVKKCRVDSIDWKGRDVYVGADLSMTNDNTSVSMVSYDDTTGKILAESFAFIPEDRIEEKNKNEHIDYRRYIAKGKCFACGSLTVDYAFIEEFVFRLEERFGVNVLGIGYDRYNALSSAQKWDTKYNTVEVKQHSSVLHAPTKWLYEKITNGEFAYSDNDLLEINFQNARCTFDTNMNRYVNKKKSNGKIDEVASLLDAVYLLQQDVIYDDGFVVQVI